MQSSVRSNFVMTETSRGRPIYYATQPYDKCTMQSRLFNKYFEQNTGQQCFPLNSRSLIYHRIRGIDIPNDVVRIIKMRNQLHLIYMSSHSTRHFKSLLSEINTFFYFDNRIYSSQYFILSYQKQILLKSYLGYLSIITNVINTKITQHSISKFLIP